MESKTVKRCTLFDRLTPADCKSRVYKQLGIHTCEYTDLCDYKIESEILILDKYPAIEAKDAKE